MWVPWGREEPFPEGRLFNTLLLCPLSPWRPISMEVQTRSQFLGEGRAAPWQRGASYPQSLSSERQHLHKVPCHRDAPWEKVVTRRMSCDLAEPPAGQQGPSQTKILVGRGFRDHLGPRSDVTHPRRHSKLRRREPKSYLMLLLPAPE